MNTITATNARNNLFNLLRKTVKGHKYTRISSREGNAILISEEEFDSLVETAKLSSIPGLIESIKEADKDIKKGDLSSIEDAFE